MAVDYGDARTGIAIVRRTGVLAEAFIMRWSPERAAEIADAARSAESGGLCWVTEKYGRHSRAPRGKKRGPCGAPAQSI